MRQESCFRALNGKTYSSEAECLLHDFQWLRVALTAKIGVAPIQGNVGVLQAVCEDARRLLVEMLRVKCDYDAATQSEQEQEQAQIEDIRQRQAAKQAEEEDWAKRRPLVRIIGKPQPLTVLDVTSIRGVRCYLFQEYPMMWVTENKVTGVPYGEHPSEQKPQEEHANAAQERAA